MNIAPTGRRRGARLSLGAAYDRFKVEVRAEEPPVTGAIDGISCIVDLATLTEIGALTVSHVPADRGHRFSDGSSVIAIWIRL